MVPFSVLDLSPVVKGSYPAQAFRNTLDLARHAERAGYNRFWLAEHHNMPGIASAATAVLIGHVAGGTSTIRVGSGGIMLPNHAPLVIAEQFGTLESLYPGPHRSRPGPRAGHRPADARALRRDPAAGAEHFPQDVMELQGYFAPPSPGQAVRAVPGAGLDVPIWLLGSSMFSAQLAAASRPAVRVRVALRARLPAGRARRLPARLQAISGARRAVCHGGHQRDRRGHRRRGASPLQVPAAAVHQPAPGRAQPPAASRRSERRRLAGRRPLRPEPHHQVLRRRLAGDRCARESTRSWR